MNHQPVPDDLRTKRWTVSCTYPRTTYTERIDAGRELRVMVAWKPNSRGIQNYIKSGGTSPMLGPHLTSATVYGRVVPGLPWQKICDIPYQQVTVE